LGKHVDADRTLVGNIGQLSIIFVFILVSIFKNSYTYTPRNHNTVQHIPFAYVKCKNQNKNLPTAFATPLVYVQ